jgi:isopentenyldiphosphate isomerase
MKEEIITVVDEEDNIIDEKPRKEVEEKNLIYRSGSAIVVNGEGKIFVHQRSKRKALYPGMWDVKVGGMVSAGETYEETAKRELYEEIGVGEANLTFLFSQKMRSGTNNVNRKVFKCIWNGPIKIEKSEIEEGKFMAIDEVKKLDEEGKLSPSAKQVFYEYLKIQEIGG